VAKRLELLRELVPGAARVAVALLVNPAELHSLFAARDRVGRRRPACKPALVRLRHRACQRLCRTPTQGRARADRSIVPSEREHSNSCCEGLHFTARKRQCPRMNPTKRMGSLLRREARSLDRRRPQLRIRHLNPAELSASGTGGLQADGQQALLDVR
jgi:hypothetical protein